MNEKDLKSKKEDRRKALCELASVLSNHTRELAAHLLESIRIESRKKQSTRFYENIHRN